ncbi:MULTISPECIES: acyl-CoA dehydrogenase family protein [unclassified Variovorax]|uniref:acyl-CoA dehydrogenase family protein n=1 Tax=unclassified Variovorax TaxID=663243 RepID=UPI0008B237E3|nr:MULTISPECIES: acyl-CoA dehydrogenase family protein [unclassified Variovorax]SEK16736.1 Acyl-CoA dehydrogenase [Variovorax sp. OK202]SFE56844.1 Acyl-CoA dehydrogenase [Variovorax sp. OK212]
MSMRNSGSNSDPDPAEASPSSFHAPRFTAAELPSDEEREMLRDSVRGFLAGHWPVATAVEQSASPQAVAAVWQQLAQQGLAALGTDWREGGLREIAIAMEELGRAACPAPLLGAALANLLLAPAKGGGTAADTFLDALHAGDASVAVAFPEHWEADARVAAQSAGAPTFSGTLRLVDGALAATHVLLVQGDSAWLIDATQPGVNRLETTALGAIGHGALQLEAVPMQPVPADEGAEARLRHAWRVLLVARAHGAARRAFDMVSDYAKERHQFGQPIGRFQAVQHKLANNLIALEGVRRTLFNAAASHDLGLPHWTYFANTAFAFASSALRQVALETHHAFGAIGYAEEHEAPRHFRRVHLDMVAAGGLHAARGAVADWLLAGEGRALPAYDLGEAGNAFREEVRAWLAQHWSGERKAAFDRLPFHDREFDASFAKDIGKTGWIGLAWPREHGGQARSPMEQVAFIEEMERAEAPRIGAAIQANALMVFGTPAQQARYLPEMLAGEAMHGMGYSEPNAGSDLASLRTSATREGDEWVINGQKIWTTTWWGKYMFLAARTDREAKPAHAGISMFIVPMDAPGIQVKPATTMYDGSFANIFYDNVRLPADALVGPLHGGWKVLTSALATERGLIGGGIVMKVVHGFELLCAQLRRPDAQGRRLADDPLVRDRVAALAAEIEVGRQLMMECAERIVDGVTPPEYGAISKVFSGELMERFGEAVLDMLGEPAALSHGAPGALDNGKFEQGLRHSLMWVISIGTNEIQRSLIAQRGLGLPR